MTFQGHLPLRIVLFVTIYIGLGKTEMISQDIVLYAINHFK